MRRILVCLLALFIGAGAALAQVPPDGLRGGTIRFDHERIVDFDVTLEVAADGALTVTERIAVVALGQQIRRGIYRDLPLVRETLLGRSEPGFDLLSVRRDGADEPYRVERASGAIRIYVGDPDVMLRPGFHRYELVYRVDRQVDFHAEFDEIYWNATGNDWAFLIERARATVVAPPGAPVLQTAGYTGPIGSLEQAVEVGRNAAGDAVFVTTRQLGAGEGMTVAVGWPKGYVAEPTGAERLRLFLEDSRQALVALCVLGLVLCYYLVAWFRVGRDPAPGTIIAVYAPTLPPAAMRYIRRMGYDDRTMAAALVSLAVKGHLAIVDEDGTPTVEARTGGHIPPSPGEEVLRRALFRSSNRVRFDEKARQTLIGARRAFKSHLDATFEKEFFRHNRPWFVVGAGLTLLGWILVAISAPTLLDALFISVWLAAWSFGVGSLVGHLVRQWQLALSGAGLASSAGALLGTMFAIPFVGAWFFGLLMLHEAVGPVAVLFLVLATAINLLFFHLLRAPTALGRKALDEIEGMRLYLTVAEADRLRFHHGTAVTPELFERFLAYAIALDVDTQWSRRFATALADAKRQGEPVYRPVWYRGAGFDPARLGALGTSLSTAMGSATAPRSSGGSGGGGRSGGGRGGGGGGGW
ncbi:MAG: DUF2207 domain-containing protein [Alphaproteobacteria bacterium]